MRKQTLTIIKYCLVIFILFAQTITFASWSDREQKRQKELEEMQVHFRWWPTDAKPSPVKDNQRSGYWWWPVTPGEAKPWGNRGYIYVYKIIFDYKEEELPPPKPEELRPSLLIKKIIKNVKIYFDYDKADLRDDHIPILEKTVKTLQRNLEADILITGNCDQRGSEAYNLRLGRQRAQVVEDFMLQRGISGDRVRIISRGKLNAIAPITDLVGMQKDRNSQFMIAEVDEVMIPYPGTVEDPQAKPIEEGKFLVEEEEEIDSGVRVSTKEYTVKKGDTLWKIAQRHLGSGHRWKYLYALNKDKIKDPNRLKTGITIIIPIE